MSPAAPKARKGEETRAQILEAAVQQASEGGFESLTIGTLAQRTGLSKSGLFAHFGSKDALQVAVLEEAERRFIERVVKPAWRAPEGLARIAAVFERWLEWGLTHGGPGGCIFLAAASELDDTPGPAREFLVALQRKWFESRAWLARAAIRTGEFRRDADDKQFAHDFYALMLGLNHAYRLMRDPEAEARTRTAFAALIRSNQPQG